MENINIPIYRAKKIDNQNKIDFKNTWCINTEENYNELIKNGVSAHFKFNKEHEHLSINNWLQMWGCKVYGIKQIHIVNGKFQYIKKDK